ncbi:MAG: DUF6362 family protein [Kiloniellales bacterium]|nr:DUF6362 family protein [Kiloniellales bacterium]
MSAKPRITRVSWPVKGTDGKTYHRLAFARPWEAPPEDAMDPETGEPKRWEPQHVRAYIRMAMDILKRLPMHRGGMPAGQRSGMPEVVRQVAESYGWDEARAVVRPSSQEISDLDRVLAWLWWLPDRRDVLIVTAVGMGLNLRAVGRMIKLHQEQVRRRERQSLQRIADRLNEGWEGRTS